MGNIVNPADFAAATIRIPIAGAIVPIRFGKERRYLEQIYNNGDHHIFLKFGRQTEKSTTVANISITQTTLTPGFRTLIVHPTAEQSKTFSEDRIKLPVTVSPYLRQFYPKNKQSIFHKRTISMSCILLRYAFLTAGRIRGIPADMLIIDEYQDILQDLVPVIEQVCFHSKYKRFLYSGTPLTEENILNHHWRNHTTMGEWAVPCPKHGTPKNKSSWHWNILTLRNIGKTSVICDRCGAKIDPQHPDAQWVMLQDPKGREDKVSWTGYHIPQLVMHFMKEASNWAELLRKLNAYTKAQFMNEVMGEAESCGNIPLTAEEVASMCNPRVKFAQLEGLVAKCAGKVYLGVDWGTGEKDSYTVAVVGGYLPGSNAFQILFTHRFVGPDTEANVYLDKLEQLIAGLNIKHLGTDYGGGEVQNGWLMRKYGLERVHKYQYVGRQRTGKIVHNEKMGRYLLSRGEVITDFISALKHKQIRLPAKEDLDEAGVFTDYTAQRGVFNTVRRYMQYDRLPGRPDDIFHGSLYCFLASMFDIPRPDIIVPRPEFAGAETLDLINSFDRDDGILPGMDFY